MNNEKTTSCLLIFIKNIEKGKVKTRLAQTLGDEKALQIYQALLNHTREICLPVPVQRHLYYSQYIDETDAWEKTNFIKKVQSKGNLGKRMQLAFQTAFRDAEKVVIIGSDCASLTSELIVQAFAQLDRFDVVLGPALDGGYYLLGMRQFIPSLFENIAWSTATVLDETIKKGMTEGHSYFLLPELSDIDYAEDWEQWGWEI